MSWISHRRKQNHSPLQGRGHLPSQSHPTSLDWIGFKQKDGFPGQWLKGRGCPIKTWFPSETVSKQDSGLPLLSTVSLNKLWVLKLKEINTKTSWQFANLTFVQFSFAATLRHCAVIVKFPWFLKG